MLSENDLKVLKAISEGESDPQSIAEKAPDEGGGGKGISGCSGEQGLISVTKSVEESVTLTDEGRKYAEEGLPERALLSFIGSGKPCLSLKIQLKRSAWDGFARRAGRS